jgi:signal transduction histidine kinase
MRWDSTIVSGFRAGIIVVQRDGTVAYLNPIGVRILEGTSLSLGDRIQDKASENSFFWMLCEAISLDYLSTRVETYLTDKNGEPMRLGFTLSELKEGGEKVGICAFFKDLRHVEMDEENENLRQRLLLLERMGAGMTGEITGPVVNLGIACGMLRDQAAREGVAVPALPRFEEEISRLEGVIREAQGFLQPVVPVLRRVRVDAILEEIVAKLAALHTGVEFEIHKPDAVDLSADADAGLLSKALSNLMVNAVDDCNGKGLVAVTLAPSRHFCDLVRLDREVRSILPGHSGKEEAFLRIAIRTGGSSIPGEPGERTFIPFHATTQRGRGTALAVAQKILSAHGGIVELAAAEGKGVEFRVKIPVAGRQTPA